MHDDQVEDTRQPRPQFKSDQITDMHPDEYAERFQTWIEETGQPSGIECTGQTQERFEVWLELRLVEEAEGAAEDGAFERRSEKQGRQD